MNKINKYFFNGDVLYLVTNYNKTTYKLIKLNIIKKKLIELDDEICEILYIFDFKKIPTNNELLVNKKILDEVNNNYGILSNIENYSFIFTYLYFLNKELQLLKGKKYIKNIGLYNDIKYDDEHIYNKIIKLIQV